MLSVAEAPFYADVADGPAGAAAFWLRAADGVRIRIGIWRDGARGSVLLFPGRTEYVEKYGRLAGELAAHGYATLAIDWRGQGLADRLGPDRDVGHVRRFADFQLDVDAVIAAARQLGLPEPLYLMAHSMGGCIGLRALMRGLPVQAAAFSAPMWGIGIRPAMRPAAWGLTTAARLTGFATRYAPGTGPGTYVRDAGFADNVLTTDPDMFAYMKEQVTAHPDLALGGPSMSWLNEALREMRRLRAAPLPDHPTLVALGSRERVVDGAAVRAVMQRWKSATFMIIEGSEHEIIMETPAIRTRFLQAATDLFQRSLGSVSR